MDFVQPIIVFFAYVVIYSYNNHKGSDIPFPKRIYVPCPNRKCISKRFPELGGVTFISFYGEEKMTCELKVCSTKKPWNPTVPLALPVAPELSALCVIRPPALKGGKNIFGNNA